MHRVRPRVVTAIGAGLALLGLVGCTMVGDNLTGLNGARGAAATSCIKTCNDQYAALYKIESKRHQAAVEACKLLTGAARDACLDAESALHKTKMDALTDAKVACHKNCHHQGAGNAG